jgi:cytochrome c553
MSTRRPAFGRSIAAVLLAVAGWAQAQPAPASAPGAPAAPAGGYAERFAAVCSACHGPQGRSSLALTPSLAGQPSFYAITQLFLFRQGRRDNPAMTAVAQGLSDADLRGFSEFIGKLPASAAAEPPADARRFARGEQVAQQHRCAACHGADYAGGQQVPRLAQQREDYLQAALRGFKSGKRVGYTPAMNEVLAGVAPDELDDLAYFLAHVGSR